MDLKLSARPADKKIFEGEGGSYYSWSASDFTCSEPRIGGGRLLLHPRGFALPHYGDSPKIGHVIQGSCTVGIVRPGAPQEKVCTVKEGDAILMPSAWVSWWFNGGDSDVVVVFVGHTSNAYVPGEFTYFLLTGTLGLLSGFSDDFIRRFYSMNEEDATKLVKSQPGTLIVKLEEGKAIPQSREESIADFIYPLGSNWKNGIGSYWTEKPGLNAKVERLGPGGVSSPEYLDSEIQATYVVKGGGRIQIVGINGERAMDASVTAGDLFVVPKFFAAAMIAGEEGMECFSVVTASEPSFGKLNGKTSVWATLSLEALEAALGVTPEFAELFKSKNTLG
ncbi:hypothetical protein NMG60_11035241 [Bertholletia excelsa]